MNVTFTRSRLFPVVMCLFTAVFALFSFLLTSCDRPVAETPAPGVEKNSFTFLGMHAQTRITDALRDWLQDKLGPEAYATRCMIDLEMHEQGFMAAYFPEIDAMNQKLNYLSQGRVEHDAIRLTYRYAKKKNTPLDFIRLIFAGDDKKPLFFFIRTTQEGPEFLGTLKEKYGPPTIVEWTDGKGRSNFWKNRNDYLIVSETKTRIGTPEFYFGFYFSDNIHSFLKKERTKREKDMNSPQDTFQKVF